MQAWKLDVQLILHHAWEDLPPVPTCRARATMPLRSLCSMIRENNGRGVRICSGTRTSLVITSLLLTVTWSFL